MECNEAEILGPHEILEILMARHIEVERELKEMGNRRRRQHLKSELDELRINLGGTLS